MPAGLTTDPHEARHAPAWAWPRDVAILVVGFAVAGALCGLIWWWWWTPPSGVILHHTWYPDAEGMDDTFSGTALFTLIGLVAGLVLGALSAWFFDRVELGTLVVVALSSALAGGVMYAVGTALAPPDPDVAARTAKDYTEVRGTLTVAGKGAFTAFPGGALLGLAAVYIGLTPTRRTRR